MKDEKETKQISETEQLSLSERYRKLKVKHPDAIFLFRDKDTYVTYFDDAENVSKILGIPLTGKETKTASFPHCELDTCLPKLIRAGKRVAICEQMKQQKQERI